MNKHLGGVVAMLLVACGGSSGGSNQPGSSDGRASDNSVLCGPSNCSGCCFNNACQVGSANAACGRAGAACSTCPSHQACSASQACALDPNQQWNVLISSATIAPDNNGSAWDGDGSAPDVFAAFPDAPVNTSVKNDALAPSWAPGEGVFAPASLLTTTGIRVQLFDQDLVSNDTITPLGVVILGDADFAAGSKTYANWGGAQQVVFKIVKH
jgi:hypothetical protein